MYGKKHKILKLTVFALALGLSSSQSFAQSSYQASGSAQAGQMVDRYTFMDGQDTRQIGCVRQCNDDLNPCDPPSYKKLDGRCARN